MPDIFQAIDELDTVAQQRVIDRLEFRGNYAPFVAMRDSYLDRLSLPPDARVCELGCGTGVVSRAIGAKLGFDGTVLGADLSRALVAEAQRRADAGGIGNVTFRADAAGGSGEPDDSCDLVVLHTLISHVAETRPVLAEAARIAKQGATVVVFDGDYASLTCHTGIASEDASVMSAVLESVVANPYIMRDLPRLMREAGLSICDVRVTSCSRWARPNSSTACSRPMCRWRSGPICWVPTRRKIGSLVFTRHARRGTSSARAIS